MLGIMQKETITTNNSSTGICKGNP